MVAVKARVLESNDHSCSNHEDQQSIAPGAKIDAEVLDTRFFTKAFDGIERIDSDLSEWHGLRPTNHNPDTTQ